MDSINILKSFDSCLSPINCSHPSIIINSKYYDLFKSGFSVYLSFGDRGQKSIVRLNRSTHPRTKEQLFKYLIDIKSKYVNHLNCYSDYYFERKGVKIPLFYLFPCGHCELCRSKKSSEYCFRAACETKTHPISPLFVTLTYRPEFLPFDGLHLDHLQKFFKRLRSRLDFFGLPTDFRYLAVGEYGCKYGRPHYHIIFWNLPIDPKNHATLLRMMSFIRYAWTKYKLNDDGKRVFSVFKGKRYYHRQSIGISKILPVESGCPAYITKYFRKDQHNKLGYPGKNFLVSSRGNGGIGSAYIDSLLDYVMDSPSVPSVSVLDEATNRLFSYPVTGYVKYRMFPSLSKAYSLRTPVGDNNYDLIKSFCAKLEYLMGVYHHLHEVSPAFRHNIFKDADVASVLKHSQYFFRLDTKDFYFEEYSFLGHYDSDELVELYFNIRQSLLNIAKKISIPCLIRSHKIYLRTLEINERFRKADRFFMYNIESNIASEVIRYSLYQNRCTF